MAHQKTCGGTITLANFFLGDPSCNYDIQLFVAVQPITNVVTINAGMTANAIDILINANRIGNTTGTLSASQVGNSLQFSISGIVLSSVEPESFTITVVNLNPGMCPAQNVQIGAFSCSFVPHTRKKKRGGLSVGQICIPPDPNNPNFCPPKYFKPQGQNSVYEFIGKDENGNCCYVLKG